MFRYVKVPLPTSLKYLCGFGTGSNLWPLRIRHTIRCRCNSIRTRRFTAKRYIVNLDFVGFSQVCLLERHERLLCSSMFIVNETPLLWSLLNSGREEARRRGRALASRSRQSRARLRARTTYLASVRSSDAVGASNWMKYTLLPWPLTPILVYECNNSCFSDNREWCCPGTSAGKQPVQIGKLRRLTPDYSGMRQF